MPRYTPPKNPYIKNDVFFYTTKPKADGSFRSYKCKVDDFDAANAECKYVIACCMAGWWKETFFREGLSDKCFREANEWLKWGNVV